MTIAIPEPEETPNNDKTSLHLYVNPNRCSCGMDFRDAGGYNALYQHLYGRLREASVSSFEQGRIDALSEQIANLRKRVDDLETVVNIQTAVRMNTLNKVQCDLTQLQSAVYSLGLNARVNG